MRRFFILLALLSLGACATRPLPDAECAANAMCAARAAEPAILPVTQGTAMRNEDDLILRPQRAPPLHLTDDMASCAQADADNCVGYALMAAVPRAHAWVAQQFLYEGSFFLLIDSGTGRQIRLNGMPAFSPDGRKFLVAPYDLESDVGPNDLEIWRRDGDGAVLEWAHAAGSPDEDRAAPPAITVTGWHGDRIALSFETSVRSAPALAGQPGAQPVQAGILSLTRPSPRRLVHPPILPCQIPSNLLLCSTKLNQAQAHRPAPHARHQQGVVRHR